MVMIGFWVVFAAFFFGLTYGLLQICTERTILRRERLVGLRAGAYVASKVTILVPFLLLVVVAMLGVLRLLDRLPESPAVDVRLDGDQPAAVRRRRPRPRPAHLRPGRKRRPSDARPADVVLSRRAVLRCHPPGEPDGDAPAPPSAWRSHRAGRSRSSVTTSERGGSSPRAARHSGLRCSRRTAMRARTSTGTYWLVLAAFAVVFLVATWAVIVRSTRN